MIYRYTHDNNYCQFDPLVCTVSQQLERIHYCSCGLYSLPNELLSYTGKKAVCVSPVVHSSSPVQWIETPSCIIVYNQQSREDDIH